MKRTAAMSVAERIRVALSNALCREIGVTGFAGYEAGDGAYFEFQGAPCGAKSFSILFDENTELCRVALQRKDRSTLQGQRGVSLSRLGSVVRRLSQHGG